MPGAVSTAGYEAKLKMSTITAIEVQKKRENRRSIFVDGEFVAGVHEETVVTLGLAVGQEFDKERLVGLLKAETARNARESAIRLISYRDRSKSEIKQRLIGNEYPEEIVDEVVDWLSRGGLLDDEKFSRDWVKARTASKPMGRARLSYELRAKGIDKPLVEEALEEIDDESEYELAYSVAEQKLRKVKCKDQAARKRLIALLRRRGFGWDAITKVIDELCPDED